MSVRKSNQQGSASAGSRAARIQNVLLDVLQRRHLGERVTDRAVIAEHVDLMPELGEELQLVAELDQCAGADRYQNIHPSRGVPSSHTLKIRCPHCHQRIEIPADAPLDGLTCRSCGSHFSLVKETSGTSAARQRLSHFELVERLGEGSFGTVWRARDTELDRSVAVKIPRSGFLEPAEAEKFLREARAAAQLHHPNIVRIYEVGRDKDTVYIVSDLVRGVPLSDRLLAHKFTAREAAQLCAKIAEALHHAHDSGVIHRDLKPQNVLMVRSDPIAPLDDGHPQTSSAVSAPEEPVIVDFGLARRETGEVTITVDGQVLGTPAYMSPEQARGEGHQADRRTDVYSLGVIFFQLLTGELPFRGATRMLLHQVIHDEPRHPRSFNDRIPRDLETICLKAMAKDSGRRYATARELTDDLRRFLDGKPIQARRMPAWERGWKWGKRRPAVAALLLMSGVALVALGMVANGLVYNGELKAVLRQTEAARIKAEQYQYYHHIARAQAEWRDGSIGRARQLLDESPRDQRGWEWAYLDRLCHGALLTLTNHTGNHGITSVAFCPDGIHLASASNDLVTVFDASTGHVLRSLTGHSGLVHGVAFSPDGHWLASSSADGTVKVWEMSGDPKEQTLNGEGSALLGVAFSPDGRRLASGSSDGKLLVWDIATRQLLYSVKGHTSEVWNVVFSPDGTRLASASADSFAKLWDAITGQPLHAHPLRSGGRLAFGVAFSPDGNQLATGGDIKIVRVWDVTTGLEVFDLPSDGHSLSFSPDGRWLVTGCGDGKMRIWDLTTHQEIRVFRGHTNEVWSVAFSPDGTRLMSASLDGTVKIWDLSNDQEPRPFQGHDEWATCVAFSPDDTLLASTSTRSGSETVNVWDTTTGQLLHSLVGHRAGVWSVAFSPDGNLMASASRDGTVRLWDPATGQARGTFTEHASAVRSVKFSPDGRLIASATGRDTLEDDTLQGEVKIWDVKSLQVVRTFHGHQDGIVTVAFSPDGNRLASASQDKTIRVWDIATGKEDLKLLGHAGYVIDMDFSPDGSLIASAGSWDGTAKIWDARTGTVLQNLLGHYSSAKAVAFSPDGTRLASASGDATVKIWDVKTGQEALTLRGFTSSIRSLAFGADGSRLAAACHDGTLRLWDARPWTPAVAVEREAVGLLDSLFAKPLRKADVIEYVEDSATIRPEARRLALSLVDRYGEENDAAKYYDAAWPVVRHPYANVFMCQFALAQMKTACEPLSENPQYRLALGVAQYRLGKFQENRYREALATLTRCDQGHPATLAFLAMTQHQLREYEAAGRTLARLREIMNDPLWATNEETGAFRREAEQLIEGSGRARLLPSRSSSFKADSTRRS